MRIERLVILAVSMVLLATSLRADHFPFNDGLLYEYERIPQTLGRYTAVFSGTANVGGVTTRVRRFEGPPWPLQQFWSETPERDKLLHGFYDTSQVLWSPPILVIDEPLFVGKTWEVNSASSDGFSIAIRYDVTTFGEVTVPAGTYQAFTIRETVEFPEAEFTDKIQRHLRGMRGLAERHQQVTDWSYADGVGHLSTVIGSRVDRLVSFRTVALEPVTWTRVRLLYR